MTTDLVRLPNAQWRPLPHSPLTDLRAGFDAIRGALTTPDLTRLTDPQRHTHRDTPPGGIPMTYPQPYPTQYIPPPPKPKPAGFAVASLVLGIVGVSLSFMPIINNFTAAGAVVGLVLGFIGLWRSKMVMSGFGVGLSGLAVILTVAAQQQLVDDLDKLGDDTPAGETRSAWSDEAEPAEDIEPPADSTPAAAELAVELRVTDKQCFGSAGCNVVVEPELTYSGMSDMSEFGSYSVTLSVTGDKSGEVISTLRATGSDYSVMPIMLSTANSGVVPTAKVVSVQ